MQIPIYKMLKSLFKQFNNLDYLIKKSFANCELKDFISLHQTFQYFANRYDLTQHTYI